MAGRTPYAEGFWLAQASDSYAEDVQQDPPEFQAGWRTGKAASAEWCALSAGQGMTNAARSAFLVGRLEASESLYRATRTTPHLPDPQGFHDALARLDRWALDAGIVPASFAEELRRNRERDQP